MVWAEHVLLRWGGTLGDDSWSCGVRIQGAPASVGDELFASQQIENAAVVVKDYYDTNGARFNAVSRLKWVKLNAIDNSGHYVDPNNTNLWEFAGDGITPPSNAKAAPQTALCITLRTDVKRGLAARGRYYIPTAAPVETNGRISSTIATEALNAATAFISAVNRLGALDTHRVGIFSARDQAVNVVTSVAVGDVLDTQQRRRKQMKEIYREAPLN